MKVALEYSDALRLLEEHLGLSPNERNTELEEILFLVVASYFSRYEGACTELHNLCRGNGLPNFEGSNIGYTVTMAIIEETACHLPLFVSHNSEHCAKVNDIQWFGRCGIILTLDRAAMRLFGNSCNAQADGAWHV